MKIFDTIEDNIKKFSPEWFLLIFVLMIWGYEPLGNNLRILVDKFGEYLFEVIYYPTLIVCLFKSKSIWTTKIRYKDIFFYLFCLFILLVHSVIFPKSTQTIENIIPALVFQVLPCFFVGLFIDIKRFEKYIYFTSVISVISQLLYFYVFLNIYYGSVDLQGDLIVPATYTLTHVLVIIWHSFKKPNLFNLLMLLASIILMLSLSNRGSIFAMLSFSVVYFIFIGENIGICMKTAIITCAVIISNYINEIMLLIFGFTQKYGLSAGIFNRFFNNEIADTNGRDNIWATTIECIQGQGLWGSGIGFDRMIDTYCHNFILEILLDFGYILGSIFLCTFFYLVIKAFICSASLVERSFVAVLCGRGFIHLFFSGSYLEDGYFFLLIGFCVSILRNSKLNY